MEDKVETEIKIVGQNPKAFKKCIKCEQIDNNELKIEITEEDNG